MRLTFLIAALWAPAAFAACPVAEDLKTGIRLTDKDGHYEILKSYTPGTVTSHYYENGALDSRVLLARGLYLVEYIEAEGGALSASGRDTYSYEFTPEKMPIPEAGKVLELPVVLNEGGDISSGLDVFEADPEITVTLGACAYRVLPVRQYFDKEDRQTYELLHYLPELGVSYLKTSFYSDGSDTYDYVAIEATN
ncbi:hypothetical protein [Pacificoceanicola onchidii]|uniref:hypothetical protein n=1 Tax=Pacificoceanicola onchidii TaxID=2562685 RepID=UPI0010A53965|nr:hypothetical protein [Pacificoceanicola onchidii]